MNILASGWTEFPHSFSFVNLEQIKAFISLGHKVYVNVKPPLQSSWNSATTITSQDSHYADILKATLPATHSVKYDLALETSVPASKIEYASSCKMLFIVSEFGLLNQRYINACGGSEQLNDIISTYNYIYTPSLWSKQALVNTGISSKIIKVAPHGTNENFNFQSLRKSSFFRDELCRSLRLDQDRMILLCIGTPVFNKGIDILMSALSKLQNSSAKLALVFKGNNDIYSSLVFFKKLISQYSLNHIQIRYIGETLTSASLSSLISGSDAYISLFRAEGFNLPVAEAYMQDKYIITSKAPPVTEYLKRKDKIFYVETDPVISTTPTGKKYIKYHEPRVDSAVNQINCLYQYWITKTNTGTLAPDELIIRPELTWLNSVSSLLK